MAKVCKWQPRIIESERKADNGHSDAARYFDQFYSILSSYRKSWHKKKIYIYIYTYNWLFNNIERTEAKRTVSDISFSYRASNDAVDPEDWPTGRDAELLYLEIAIACSRSATGSVRVKSRWENADTRNKVPPPPPPASSNIEQLRILLLRIRWCVMHSRRDFGSAGDEARHATYSTRTAPASGNGGWAWRVLHHATWPGIATVNRKFARTMRKWMRMK
jgi:hypothetical protein